MQRVPSVYHFHCFGSASDTIDLTGDDEGEDNTAAAAAELSVASRNSTNVLNPSTNCADLEKHFLSLTRDMMTTQWQWSTNTVPQSQSVPLASAGVVETNVASSTVTNLSLVFTYPVSFSSSDSSSADLPQLAVASSACQQNAGQPVSVGSIAMSNLHSNDRLANVVSSRSANPPLLSQSQAPLASPHSVLQTSLSSVTSRMRSVPVSIRSSTNVARAITAAAGASTVASTARVPLPSFTSALRPRQVSGEIRTMVHGVQRQRGNGFLRACPNYRVFRLQPRQQQQQQQQQQRQSIRVIFPSVVAANMRRQLQVPAVCTANLSPICLPVSFPLASSQYPLLTAFATSASSVNSSPVHQVAAHSSMVFPPTSGATLVYTCTASMSGSQCSTDAACSRVLSAVTGEFVDVESIDAEQLPPIVIAPDNCIDECSLPADSTVRDTGVKEERLSPVARRRREVVCIDVDERDDNIVDDDIVNRTHVETGESLIRAQMDETSSESTITDESCTDAVYHLLPTVACDSSDIPAINIVPDNSNDIPVEVNDMQTFDDFTSVQFPLHSSVPTSSCTTVVGNLSAVNSNVVTVGLVTPERSCLVSSPSSTAITCTSSTQSRLMPKTTEGRNSNHTIHYLPQSRVASYVNVSEASGSNCALAMSSVISTPQPAPQNPTLIATMPPFYVVSSLVSSQPAPVNSALFLLSPVSAPSVVRTCNVTAVASAPSIVRTCDVTAVATQLVSGLRSDAMRRRATSAAAAKVAMHQSTQPTSGSSVSRKRHTENGGNNTSSPAKSSRYIPPDVKRSYWSAKRLAKSAFVSSDKLKENRTGETVVYHLNEDGSIEIRLEKGSITENTHHRNRTTQRGGFDAIVELGSSVNQSWCSETFVADMGKYYDNVKVVGSSENDTVMSGKSLHIPKSRSANMTKQESRNDAETSSSAHGIRAHNDDSVSDNESRDTLSLVLSSVEPSDDEDGQPSAVDTEVENGTGLKISRVCSIDAETFTDLNVQTVVTRSSVVSSVPQEEASAGPVAEDVEISRQSNSDVSENMPPVDVSVCENKDDTETPYDKHDKNRRDTPTIVLEDEERSPLDHSGDTSLFEISLESDLIIDTDAELESPNASPKRSVDLFSDVVVPSHADNNSQHTVEQQSLMSSAEEVHPTTQISNDLNGESGEDLPSVLPDKDTEPECTIEPAGPAVDDRISTESSFSVLFECASRVIPQAHAEHNETATDVSEVVYVDEYGKQHSAIEVIDNIAFNYERQDSHIVSSPEQISADPTVEDDSVILPSGNIGTTAVTSNIDSMQSIFPSQVSNNMVDKIRSPSHNLTTSCVENTSEISCPSSACEDNQSICSTGNESPQITSKDGLEWSDEDSGSSAVKLPETNKSASPTRRVSCENLSETKPISPVPKPSVVNTDLNDVEPDDDSNPAVAKRSVMDSVVVSPVPAAEKLEVPTTCCYRSLLNTEPVSPLPEPPCDIINVSDVESDHSSTTVMTLLESSVTKPSPLSETSDPPTRCSYGSVIDTEPVSLLPGPDHSTATLAGTLIPVAEKIRSKTTSSDNNFIDTEPLSSVTGPSDTIACARDIESPDCGSTEVTSPPESDVEKLISDVEKLISETGPSYNSPIDTEPVSLLPECDNKSDRSTLTLAGTLIPVVEKLKSKTVSSYSYFIDTEPVSIVTGPSDTIALVHDVEPPDCDSTEMISLPASDVEKGPSYNSRIDTPVSPLPERDIKSDHSTPMLAGTLVPVVEKLTSKTISNYSKLIHTEPLSTVTGPSSDTIACAHDVEPPDGGSTEVTALPASDVEKLNSEPGPSYDSLIDTTVSPLPEHDKSDDSTPKPTSTIVEKLKKMLKYKTTSSYTNLIDTGSVSAVSGTGPSYYTQTVMEPVSTVSSAQPCDIDTDVCDVESTHSTAMLTDHNTEDHVPVFETEKLSAVKGNVIDRKPISPLPEAPLTSTQELCSPTVPVNKKSVTPARDTYSSLTDTHPVSSVPEPTHNTVASLCEHSGSSSISMNSVNLEALVTEKPSSAAKDSLRSQLHEIKSASPLSIFDKPVLALKPCSPTWLSDVASTTSKLPVHSKHTTFDVRRSRGYTAVKHHPTSVDGVKRLRESTRVPKRITLADYRNRKNAGQVTAADNSGQQAEPSQDVDVVAYCETEPKICDSSLVFSAPEVLTESHSLCFTASTDGAVAADSPSQECSDGSRLDCTKISENISESRNLQQIAFPSSDLTCYSSCPAESNTCNSISLETADKTNMLNNADCSSKAAEVVDCAHGHLSEKQSVAMAARTEHCDIMTAASFADVAKSQEVNEDSIVQLDSLSSRSCDIVTSCSNEGQNTKSMVENFEPLHCPGSDAEASDDNTDPVEAGLTAVLSITTATDAEMSDDAFSSEREKIAERKRRKAARKPWQFTLIPIEADNSSGYEPTMCGGAGDVRTLPKHLQCRDHEFEFRDLPVAVPLEPLGTQSSVVIGKNDTFSSDGQTGDGQSHSNVAHAADNSTEADAALSLDVSLEMHATSSTANEQVKDSMVEDISNSASTCIQSAQSSDFGTAVAPSSSAVGIQHIPSTSESSNSSLSEINLNSCCLTTTTSRCSPEIAATSHSDHKLIHKNQMEMCNSTGTAGKRNDQISSTTVNSETLLQPRTQSTSCSEVTIHNLPDSSKVASKTDYITECSSKEFTGMDASAVVKEDRKENETGQRKGHLKAAAMWQESICDWMHVDISKHLDCVVPRYTVTNDYFAMKHQVMRLMKSVTQLAPDERAALQDTMSRLLVAAECLFHEELVYVDIAPELNNSEAKLLVEKQLRMNSLLGNVESQLHELSMQLYNLPDAEAEFSCYEKADWCTEFDLHYNILLLTRHMLYKEMSSLRCYHNSRMVYRLPDELCLDMEHDRFVSIEGSILFLEFSILSLAECRQLLALKVEIEEAHSKLAQQDDDSHLSDESNPVACQLGWLHTERRRRLNSISIKSVDSLQTFQTFLTQQLHWYRYVELFAHHICYLHVAVQIVLLWKLSN